MAELFRVLERGGLGVFESPTGTGKSMAIICGVLTWITQHHERRKRVLKQQSEINKDDDNDDDDDWLKAAAAKKEREEQRFKAREELKFLLDKEEKMEELRRRRKVINKSEREQQDSKTHLGEVADKVDTADEEEDEELLLEDYVSDDDDEQGKKKKWSELEDLEEEEEKEDYSLRVYYTSRTHSQLSQFVHEIQKSPFGKEVRVVSLASRNNLCVNDAVRKLGSNALINERCLEMQKSKSKPKGEDSEVGSKKRRAKSSKCPFNKLGSINKLRDRSLLQVLDIEELAAAGREMSACPYYASRAAVEDAQLVVLPYNTLLHAPTREAVGIRLKGSVVVVDEAHNLLDTISHIHSVTLTGEQLCHSHIQLQTYVQRYRSRLKAKNLLYLKQIMFVLTSLAKIFGVSKKETRPEQELKADLPTRLVEAMTFLTELEIFNLDLFKLIRYVRKSKLVQKLHGFSDKYACKVGMNHEEKTRPTKGVEAFLKNMNKKEESVENEKENEEGRIRGSPLMVVVELLEALTSVNSEARVMISPQKTLGESHIKYCLLSPSCKFSRLVQECRSVVVAGGTMQPPSEFVQQLFLPSGADESRVTLFSCGHVIPKENVLPLVLHSEPSGKPMDFSYERRDLKDTKEGLYRVLSNVCKLVPGGVVVFFPSYEYEGRIHEYFKSVGYLDKLGEKKRLFREPKRAMEMETVLKDYSKAARLGGGALLFSVVGGKMSEGINFSDELGRCVVMVGLPFPNARSPELKEKMSYLDATVGAGAGRAHYENLCMKAVNQSIGRAIRHRGDYACILLVDRRYQRPAIMSHLPGWIREQVRAPDNFGRAILALREFFRAKKQGC